MTGVTVEQKQTALRTLAALVATIEADQEHIESRVALYVETGEKFPAATAMADIIRETATIFADHMPAEGEIEQREACRSDAENPYERENNEDGS